MIDAEAIKSRVDCRDIIERDLGKPKTHSSKYNAYKCPLHHEQKGYSFVVYEDSWRCLGRCQTGGDVFAWLKVYHDMDFKTAIRYLSGGNVPLSDRPRPEQVESSSEPPSAEWQASARRLVHKAQNILHSPLGTDALHYLTQKRGLGLGTVLGAQLGYVPGHYTEWQEIEGLTVPCGILIPWECHGALWAINVRRAAGEPKYQQVKGGHIRGALFGIDYMEDGLPVLFTEGEFDCLIARMCGLFHACPVTLGGASNQLNHRWHRELASSRLILAVTDKDEAGEKAAARLGALSARIKRITVPLGKDMNDFLLTTDVNTVSQWIQGVVS